MVLRKVDSSTGAGFHGEGIGIVGGILEVGGFAGALPELFLGLAIVVLPCRTSFSKDKYYAC